MMNKKIIALAVAFAATGVNAATLYEADNTEVKFKGGVNAFLNTWELDVANSDGDKEGDWDVTTKAYFQFDGTTQLNDSVALFASFEVETKDDGLGFENDDQNTDFTADDVYIGAKFGENFGIAVGETGDFADSTDVIDLDNTSEGVGYFDDISSNNTESKGHSIAAKYDMAGLELIGDIQFTDDEDVDAIYGISAAYSIEGLTVGAMYKDRGNNEGYNTTDADNNNNGAETDNSTMGFSVGYEVDAFGIQAAYIMDEIQGDDIDAIALTADANIDAARLYVSYFTAENDDASTNDEQSGYTVGAAYKVSKAFKVFAEYTAISDYGYTDGNDADAMTVGAYYSF